MIRLTRIRHAEPLYLNPDRVERIDAHADTVVRMENGNEYVVSESADEIVELIMGQRAHVLAMSYDIAANVLRARDDEGPDAGPGAEEDSATCPPH